MPNDSFLKKEDVTFSRQYRRAVWWVGHRDKLKRVGAGVLLVFNAALITFVGWTFLDVYAVSYDREQAEVVFLATNGQEDLRAYSERAAARPLEAEAVRVISSGPDRSDYFTRITNPNPDWYAEIRYSFVTDAGSTPAREGFILPAEQKPLMELSHETSFAPRGATLELEVTRWRRVDRHAYTNFDAEAFREDRLRLLVSNIRYDTGLALDGNRFGRVSFTVKNASPFSYFQPVFLAVLLRGDQVVGVNRVQIDELSAGQQREVVMNWFGALPAVSTVEIVPEIRLFDKEAYK